MEWLLTIILVIFAIILSYLVGYLLGKQTNVRTNVETKPAEHILTQQEIKKMEEKYYETEKKLKYFNNFMSFDGKPQKTNIEDVN